MNTDRKKVLFLSSRPIFPIKGGDQIRTAQQLSLLLESFDVDILYLTINDTDTNPQEVYSRINKVFRFKIQKYKHYLNTLRFLFNKLPLQVNYYYTSEIQRFVDSIASDYDIIFCNNIRTAQYAIHRSNVKFIDFVDAISMNYEKAKRHSRGLKKLIYSIDYKRCRDYEQVCIDKFDRCSVISEVDKEYLQCHKR